MFNKNKYRAWQIANKEHIMIVFNMIVNKLERNDMMINEKKNLYSDIVYFLYINQE